MYRQLIALGCWALIVVDCAAQASEVADAAMHGNAQAVQAALDRGADVNARQTDGSTALHWAVRNDDVALTALLINHRADTEVANRTGATPLRLAAINGSAQVSAALLDAGVDVNARLTEHGDTALMFAARAGKPDGLEATPCPWCRCQCGRDLGRDDGTRMGNQRGTYSNH